MQYTISICNMQYAICMCISTSNDIPLYHAECSFVLRVVAVMRNKNGPIIYHALSCWVLLSVAVAVMVIG